MAGYIEFTIVLRWYNPTKRHKGSRELKLLLYEPIQTSTETLKGIVANKLCKKYPITIDFDYFDVSYYDIKE